MFAQVRKKACPISASKPEEAANIARQSNAKQLVLTNFDANMYRTLKDRCEAETAAKRIFKNTIHAYDGLEVEP